MGKYIDKNNIIGKTNYNNQGCLMKIIDYTNARNIIVQFQDEYKCNKKCEYSQFKKGNISNPYFPSVYGHGMIGEKYHCKINGKDSKEYLAWHAMLSRCYNEKSMRKYEKVYCCKEWLLFDNFYEWLHSQPNFNIWKNETRSALDKDILKKGNKLYSPETCCLVPNNINVLFTKRQNHRGNEPIGVILHKRDNIYESHCNNGYGVIEYLGRFSNVYDAFIAYKTYKENLIKKMATIEYNKGRISKICYEAMINYVVEITD